MFVVEMDKSIKKKEQDNAIKATTKFVKAFMVEKATADTTMELKNKASVAPKTLHKIVMDAVAESNKNLLLRMDKFEQ